tara:strand:+ start:11844 stop:12431 length:588 start_codon:yes stop_codon:yes gene_type:complete
MATFINRLEDKASGLGIERNTAESLKWFKGQMRNITMPSRPKLIADENFDYTNKPLVGRMFMYVYDPKHKKTLPYYDRFPLIFLVEKAKGGFTGLNMHYLPHKFRAILFDNLQNYTNNKKYNKTTRLRLKYDFLKSNARLRYFAPCYKRYLNDHVKSRIVEIPAQHWESVLFLPSEQFKKNTKATVWTKSRKQIN